MRSNLKFQNNKMNCNGLIPKPMVVTIHLINEHLLLAETMVDCTETYLEISGVDRAMMDGPLLAYLTFANISIGALINRQVFARKQYIFKIGAC